jgi:serine/alanine adding enzyme
MGGSMKVVNHLERQAWRDFVDNHPEANVYHTPEMFDVYSQAKGYRPFLWAVVEGERILALHLPVQITLAGGPFRYLTSRDVTFGGVLAAPGESGRQALGLLLREYNRRLPGSPLFTELRNGADQSHLQNVLESHGYRFEGHLNYLLDLEREEEDILGSFSKSARNRIHRCVRGDDTVVREMIDREMLRELYTLFRKTYRHAHVPLADISLFETAFDLLRQKGMAYFSIAFAEGMPAAGQVSIRYKDVITGWYNGVDRSAGWSCNELVVWDAIQWGWQNGCRVFDFGGAGKPGEESGVRDFKSKFRGTLVDFGRNTRVHAPARMRVSEAGYQAVRNGLEFLQRAWPGHREGGGER